MKLLEKGTFGKSKCEQDFIDILNKTEDDHLKKKVCQILNRYYNGIRDLENNTTHKTTFASMWREKYVTQVRYSDFPVKVKSYMMNLISTKYKNILHNAPKKRP